MNDVPQVYSAIAAITASLSKDGITKKRQNKQQGYAFRGIDDVYNVLATELAAHGLCILPRVTERAIVERESKSGGSLFYVTVAVEFDLVSAKDGSRHTVRMYGEAMDSADKATNKAMSAAYKYMALEVFCIPTEGDNDADGTTHEVVAKQETRPVGVDRDGQFRIPGGPEKWDGLGGTLISDPKVSGAALCKVKNWLEKKGDPKNQALIDAMSAELESRRETLDRRLAVLNDPEEDREMDARLARSGK